MKLKEKSQIDLLKIIFRKHSKAYFYNLFHLKIPSSRTLLNRGDRLLWQTQIREGMMSNTGSSIILRIRHVSSESRNGFFMLLFWPRWLAMARWLVVVANFVFQQEWHVENAVLKRLMQWNWSAALRVILWIDFRRCWSPVGGAIDAHHFRYASSRLLLAIMLDVAPGELEVPVPQRFLVVNLYADGEERALRNSLVVKDRKNLEFPKNQILILIFPNSLQLTKWRRCHRMELRWRPSSFPSAKRSSPSPQFSMQMENHEC